jgi:hypothetical protein
VSSLKTWVCVGSELSAQAIKFGTAARNSWHGDTLLAACHRRFTDKNGSRQYSTPPVPGGLCSYMSSSLLYPNGDEENLGRINSVRIFDIPDNTKDVERVAKRKALDIMGRTIPHHLEFHDMNHPKNSEARAAHAASWLADGVTFHGYNHYYSDVCIDALRAWADREGHVLIRFEYGNKTFGKRTFYRIEEVVFSAGGGGGDEV